MYLGNRAIDDILTFAVATCDPTASGAAADVDASGVPAYRVYEDETGTAILTGNMAKLDDANTLGLYSEQLTLSAANGFENGKSYTIYVSATVGGVAGTTERHFSVGGIQRANVVQYGGTAGTFSGGRPEVNTSHWGGTAVASAFVRGNLLQIEGADASDIFDALDADIASVAAAVAGLNDISATDVWAAATRTLTSGANIALAKGTGVTGFNDLSAGDVRTAVGLASANLDDQFAALPTAAENADATWTEAVADHSGVAGSTAEALNAAGAAGDPWTTVLPGSYTGSQAGKIIADLLVDTTAIDNETTSISAAIAALNDISAADVWAATTRTLSSGANIALAKGTGVTGFNDISATDVWSAATRVLTSGANIALAKGVGVTGFNDIQASDVWSVGVRTLTAGTNIALAKGVGVTGFNDLDATGIRTAVGMSAADLDSQLDALVSDVAAVAAAVAVVDATADAIALDTGTDGVVLTAGAVDAIHDEPIPEPAGMYNWPATSRQIQAVLGLMMRNEVQSDADSVDAYNDAGDTVLWSYPSSDDGTVFISGEAA